MAYGIAATPAHNPTAPNVTINPMEEQRKQSRHSNQQKQMDTKKTNNGGQYITSHDKKYNQQSAVNELQRHDYGRRSGRRQNSTIRLE